MASPTGREPDATRAAASSPSVAHDQTLAPGLRRELLTELRRGGPASPDSLAARIGASRTGVVQQLRALEAAGLLAAVESVGGPELLAAVFEARREELGQRLRTKLAARVPSGASLDERVRELAVIQDEEGYLCRAEPDGEGGMRLREHNCAIFHVANGTPDACDNELALFREVLDADVVRESHIASGDRCCTYRITPRG